MRNGQSFFTGFCLRIERLCLAGAVPLLLLCSCSLFVTGTDDDATAPGTGPVSAERIRARKASGQFICLIAETGKPFAAMDPESGKQIGIEPEIVRALAAKLNLNVLFIKVPAVQLSAALRNGRGDIAAGKLDTALIRSLYLEPVLPYAPADGGDLALMIRPDDIQWRETIERAAREIPMTKIVSAHSNTVNSATVKVLTPDAAMDSNELSVSVDLSGKGGAK